MSTTYKFLSGEERIIVKTVEEQTIYEERFSLNDLQQRLALAQQGVVDAQARVAQVEADIAEIEKALGITIKP